jgi:hypothetical protein
VQHCPPRKLKAASTGDEAAAVCRRRMISRETSGGYKQKQANYRRPMFEPLAFDPAPYFIPLFTIYRRRN